MLHFYNFLVFITLKLLFPANSMAIPAFISDEQVKELLDWDTLIPAVEAAMGDLSKNEVIQPSRLVMALPSKNGYGFMLYFYYFRIAYTSFLLFYYIDFSVIECINRFKHKVLKQFFCIFLLSVNK